LEMPGRIEVRVARASGAGDPAKREAGAIAADRIRHACHGTLMLTGTARG